MFVYNIATNDREWLDDVKTLRRYILRFTVGTDSTSLRNATFHWLMLGLTRHDFGKQ